VAELRAADWTVTVTRESNGWNRYKCISPDGKNEWSSLKTAYAEQMGADGAGSSGGDSSLGGSGSEGGGKSGGKRHESPGRVRRERGARHDDDDEGEDEEDSGEEGGGGGMGRK
jgi:hypothetical protein